MKLAVCTVAYNELEWIQKCIGQFKPFVERHTVLVSSKPWFGAAGKDDGTAELARKDGAEVCIEHWQSEEEQRNWGLSLLMDFDYVLIVDADELYSRSGIETMIAAIESLHAPYFRIREMRTYWKTTNYVCAPLEGWDAPVVAVDPKQVRFYKQRQVEHINGTRSLTAATLPGMLHHMSWVKSDEKIRQKIESFSHAEHIRPGWYENVWLRWSPEMRDIAPYSFDEMHAVYSPCPDLDD